MPVAGLKEPAHVTLAHKPGSLRGRTSATASVPDCTRTPSQPLSQPLINIIVALPTEASPVVKHWRLKKSNRQHPFTLFAGDDLRLAISGIGKCNSAAATAWLSGIESSYRQRNSIWLNFGIAGHCKMTVGTIITASRILDTSTNQSWFPTLIRNPLTKACIQTVDQPALAYPNNNALEMEASGFYSTALKISTSELVQCFKVISDNNDHPASDITPAFTRTLIGDSLADFAAQLEIVKTLATESEIVDSADTESLYHAQWKFTETQKNRLQRLLHKQFALDGHYEKAHQLLDDRDTRNLSPQSLLNRMDSLQGTPGKIESK